MKIPAILAALAMAATVSHAAPPVNVAVRIDASADHGAYYRPYRCYSGSSQNADFSEEDKQQLATLGNAELVKIWLNTKTVTDAYILDAASRGERVIFGYNDHEKTTYQDYFDAIVRGKILVGDKFEYLESMNEPSNFKWTSDQVYASYKACYQAAADYNAKHSPKVPVKVGGVGFWDLKVPEMGAFLDNYARDPDPKKRLDFISYHQYAWYYKMSNHRVADDRLAVIQLLKDRELPADTPQFITESSIFGAQYDDPAGDDVDDQLKQAAGMAVRNYYWTMSHSPADRQFLWVAQKNDNHRKCMLDLDVEGVATPYLNMLKMYMLMKRNRISDGKSNPDGFGLNVFATKDETGIAVMLMNYHHGDSPEEYLASLTIDNLPAAFKNRAVRVDEYLLDRTHNHSRTGDDGKTLKRLTSRVAEVGEAFTSTEAIGKHTVKLLVLTPEPPSP